MGKNQVKWFRRWCSACGHAIQPLHWEGTTLIANQLCHSCNPLCWRQPDYIKLPSDKIDMLDFLELGMANEKDVAMVEYGYKVDGHLLSYVKQVMWG